MRAALPAPSLLQHPLPLNRPAALPLPWAEAPHTQQRPSRWDRLPPGPPLRTGPCGLSLPRPRAGGGGLEPGRPREEPREERETQWGSGGAPGGDRAWASRTRRHSDRRAHVIAPAQAEDGISGSASCRGAPHAGSGFATASCRVQCVWSWGRSVLPVRGERGLACTMVKPRYKGRSTINPSRASTNPGTYVWGGRRPGCAGPLWTGPDLALFCLRRSRGGRGRKQHAGPGHHPAPQHVPAEGAEVSAARP